jgi:hypothetical protein
MKDFAQKKCSSLSGAARNQLKEAWAQLLEENGQWDAFVTVGFNMYLDVPRAVSCLNHVLLRLNRSLYSKRFQQQHKSLTGIAILEFKRGSKCSLNGPHFHLLLRGDEPLDCSKLAELLDRHSARLRYPTGNRFRPFGRRISGPGFVDVRPIDHVHGLADYLTKELRYQSRSSCGRGIGFVSRTGVEGLDHDYRH